MRSVLHLEAGRHHNILSHELQGGRLNDLAMPAPHRASVSSASRATTFVMPAPSTAHCAGH